MNTVDLTLPAELEQQIVDAWEAVVASDMDELQDREFWRQFRQRNERLAEAYDQVYNATRGSGPLRMLLIDARSYRRGRVEFADEQLQRWQVSDVHS